MQRRNSCSPFVSRVTEHSLSQPPPTLSMAVAAASMASQRRAIGLPAPSRAATTDLRLPPPSGQCRGQLEPQIPKQNWQLFLRALPWPLHQQRPTVPACNSCRSLAQSHRTGAKMGGYCLPPRYSARLARCPARPLPRPRPHAGRQLYASHRILEPSVCTGRRQWCPPRAEAVPSSRLAVGTGDTGHRTPEDGAMAHGGLGLDLPCRARLGTLTQVKDHCVRPLY